MISIEKKLIHLFDYQRFEKNKDLQSIIDDTEDRYQEVGLLADYQLSFVAGGKKEHEDLEKDDFGDKQS